MVKISKINSLIVVKRIVAIALVLALMVLAGCKDNNTSSEVTGSSNPEQNISSEDTGNTDDDADQTDGEDDADSEDSTDGTDSSDDATDNTDGEDSTTDDTDGEESVDDKDSTDGTDDSDDSTDDTDGEDINNGGQGNTGNSGNSGNSGNTGSTPSININPLDGQVSVGTQIDSIVIRDDDGEIVPENGIENLSTKLTGVADDEADALRDKILNTGNTEEYYDIKGTKYYISPGGDDVNPGDSPEKPLRTVDGLVNLDLKEGDAVLFERGSVFRLNSSISTKDGIIYGSYGEGDKPKLYGSGMNFATAEWSPTQRKNIWRTMYIYDAAGTMVFNHGEAIGCKKMSVRNLTENLHFFQSEEDGYIYLYCDKGNPAAIYESIEVTSDIRIFFIPSRRGNVVIDNLCLMYSSSFAVAGNYNCHDVTVTNCEIGYIGGYMRNGTTRLGNAIQMWTGIQGFTVENNWIYQTFDTAITWQGNGGEGFKYSDISIKGNLLEYNHTDIEFWDSGATLDGFTITDNIFRLTQMGWGARENDGGIRGFDGAFHGTTNGMNIVGKIIVKNNLIDSPGGRIFRWGTEQGDWDKHFDFSGTRIYITGKYRYTNQVIRQTYGSAATADNLFANNADELKAAFQRVDPTIEVKWK